MGIRHDIKGILDYIGESENSGNPVSVQVDNFPISDGEVDQPVYEGPQTWSCTNKLMKANILMDQMFDVDYVHLSETDNVVDSIPSTESLRDLILQFWYQQVFTVYMVCCDLAELLSHHGSFTLILFGWTFMNLYNMFLQIPHPLIEFATELALQEYFQASSSVSEHASPILGLMLAYFTLII